MRFYETTFIARQDLPQTQVDNLTTYFSDLIKGEGGEVLFTENWGLRQLAYKVKKNKKGHYVFLALKAPPAVIAEMERQMRFNEDILRYLSVQTDEAPEAPTALLKDRLKDEQRSRSYDAGDAADASDDQPEPSLEAQSSSENPDA